MKVLAQWVDRNSAHVFVSLFTLVIAGLLYSTFLFGLGYGLFLVFALFQIFAQRRNELPLSRKSILGVFSLWLILLPYLLSYFWSDNIDFWANRVRLKLPFLVFPFLLIFIRPQGKKVFLIVCSIAVSVLTLSTIPHLWHWAMNWRDQLSGITSGNTLSTPINHIRYSLLIALSILWSVVYLLEGKPSPGWQRYGLIVMTTYLVLVIHILSVRSGILGLYFGLLVYVIYILRTTEKRKYALLLLYGLIAAGFLWKLPTIQNKWRYTKEAYWAMKYDGRGGLYSDVDRYYSWKHGLDIFSENRWFGVGIGDLADEMDEKWQQMENSAWYKHILPHNQLITYLAGCGLLGGIMFLIGWFGILSLSRFWNNPYLITHYSVFTLSWLFENTLASALGVALFLFPILLIIICRQE